MRYNSWEMPPECGSPTHPTNIHAQSRSIRQQTTLNKTSHVSKNNSFHELFAKQEVVGKATLFAQYHRVLDYGVPTEQRDRTKISIEIITGAITFRVLTDTIVLFHFDNKQPRTLGLRIHCERKFLLLNSVNEKS